MEEQKQVVKRNNKPSGVVLLEQIAKQEGIPPTGLTIMAGRPYINVTGLDVKLKNLCQERKLELGGIEAKRIVEPTSDNGYLVGYHAEVVLFDRENFIKALGKIGQIDKETLQELRESFTYRYTGEGWASPLTCEGIGYRYHWVTVNGRHKKVKDEMLLENIIMMAERRATNRAKREATGTGLTSVDEIPTEQPEAPQPTAEPEPEPKSKDDFTTEVKRLVATNDFKTWCKEHAIFNMKEVKEMLKLHFNKPLHDITVEDIKEWEQYIEGEQENIISMEEEDGTEQGENLQSNGAVPKRTRETAQDKLLNDSD